MEIYIFNMEIYNLISKKRRHNLTEGFIVRKRHGLPGGVHGPHRDADVAAPHRDVGADHRP